MLPASFIKSNRNFQLKTPNIAIIKGSLHFSFIWKCLKMMARTMMLAGIIFTTSLMTGCATTAQTEFYRPANYSGEPYEISGKLEPMKGWNGVVSIYINNKEVINKALPFFTNTTDASGFYEDKKISATITKVNTFMSSYIRADVFVGSEKAASLTF